MHSTLVVLGYVAAFMTPGLGCLPKEYVSRDGKCCPMCNEGTVVRRDCTLKSGTRCSSCVNGTFMNKPNGLSNCIPCIVCDQGHGLFVKQECTATTNTVCDVSSGCFCKELMDDTGCSLAQKHTQCTPGERIKELGTRTKDTVCEQCQPGYFSKDGVNCTDWTICLDTQVQVTEGSTSTDVVCGTASRQRYCLYIPLSLFTSALILAVLVITELHPQPYQRIKEARGLTLLACGDYRIVNRYC
ncbi:tumor necrosis factor receptor superfamily member 14-like isoform X2 [Perca fluviatilis]|uniref:tumor necrosis factor receptor superfamily member 14-like isoform X2 n=1 Tax=Perca fluviatilis TaxID=8168 RepID=UPI0019649403|nr:tumor necrosis factor receptor superfamily member 14-like isoform X2 [Perca fluviatilis]XP_039656633.1 tumor necrosis factor receptor superfamily member 14-like isoform X2 [Perca fluviatilis]XP_039656634.1 tumor necrosis factor receptor superfamily member 14-like isoform X2 [Perca fluviatilis]